MKRRLRTGRNLLFINLFSFLLFDYLEIFLADSAQRAYPVCREIFESCSRLDSAVRIAYCRIVLVSADDANVLFHTLFLFKSL